MPGIVDRDRCIAALKIHACAVAEAKFIPAEYCKMFGEDGYWMYNQLIAHIGKRDKRCLPFVNLCLWVWMEKLTEDMNLWDDVASLDFDKCVQDEMVKTRTKRGKTSHELMMATFAPKPISSSKICSWWHRLTLLLLQPVRRRIC